MLKILNKLYYGRHYGYRVLFSRSARDTGSKPGIILADVGMPEDCKPGFYNSYMDHVFHYSIPSFLHRFILTDRGLSLIDPSNPMAREEFTPTRLVDMYGSDQNREGRAYIDCGFKWQPPGMKKNPWDFGYFLYRGDGPGGAPNICQKVAAKVAGWYYGMLLPEKKIAWEYQCGLVFNEVKEKLQKEFPAATIVHASYSDRTSLRQAVNTCLENDCDTIIYQSFCNPVYSDFEEYASVMPLLHDMVAGRARMVFAEQPGVQDSYQQAFVELVADCLKDINPSSSILLVLSKHGIPFKNDTCNTRGHLYRKPLEQKMRSLFDNRKGSWDLIWSDDEYADPYWDPKNTRLSTLEAFRIAIDKGYDYALEISTEFIAENTDKMIYHALKKFTVFPDFDVNRPVPYPDWDKPLVRTFSSGKTKAISLGCPVGKYRKFIVDAITGSILDLRDNNNARDKKN
ncbi:MAG: hypothetical protein V2I37_04700 [Marinilabiliaceae bacterium]|nr:hypothetical protein [Marinilabiliaceae bacterium]